MKIDTENVTMKVIIYTCLILLVVAQLILSGPLSYKEISMFLMLLCINIYREKYNSSLYVIFLQCFTNFLLIISNKGFLYFYLPIVVQTSYVLSCSFIELPSYLTSSELVEEYDFHMTNKALYFIIIIFILILPLNLLNYTEIINFYFLFILCVFLGNILSKYNYNNLKLKTLYDKERIIRYQLEEAKNKLTISSEELVRLTEIKERNRIAREIHDNTGHSIAGVLMQLQASYKIHSKNQEKSLELLKKSIDELQKTLVALRETVHNISPGQNLGIDYIKNVLTEFSFCTVDFKYFGDFNELKPNHVQVLRTNLKEALTNIYKYSNATNVIIRIDINPKFIRLYIKDNGTGCNYVSEGLGISGIKERVTNLGGTTSIDGRDGFLIVCIIPIEEI